MTVKYKSYFDMMPIHSIKSTGTNSKYQINLKGNNNNKKTLQKKIVSNGSSFLNTPKKDPIDNFYNNFGLGNNILFCYLYYTYHTLLLFNHIIIILIY